MAKVILLTSLQENCGFYFFEADQYFTNEDGIYKFVSQEIKAAHIYCQRKTEWALCSGESVIVSNTFTQEWEMQPYVEMAKKYNARVVSMIVENRHGNSSVHDVPADTIEKMRNRFEVKL